MIPKEAKLLFITCYSDYDKQFNGISNIIRKLSVMPQFYSINWQEHSRIVMDLSTDNNIENIIISGHGAFNRASITDNYGNYLDPDSIIISQHTGVFLLCCYQGKQNILKEWADKLHTSAGRIKGCPSETETALSTLLLMHVLKEGIAVLPSAFETWCGINRYLKPYFGILRTLYKTTGGNPLETIKEFTEKTDLSGFNEFSNEYREFISIAGEYPEFLKGLS